MRVDRVRRAIGTFWNVIVVVKMRDSLRRWWPETGSNRRRQPFQGRLPSMLSGLGSMQVVEEILVTRNYFGLGWDHLGSFRFLCVRYLYVDPVFRGVP